MAGSVTGRSAGNGMAVASLVCGIVGLLVYGIVLGPLAVILGLVAHGKQASGMAKAGIVLGAIATVFAIAGIIWMSGNGLLIGG
ncbi:DUF4190 domain-containing protein [Streptomyces chumphonensis]|uniref:DUF4190 domain-containing protein n=1 Tax=Streptomyces chumphonensis TaxID=1214925 RepID=A0A927EYH3_9ACTN|nr:DUF4190 domain-containing protein [Streptomyces chumphonensis]MBD3932320.1 DUF4190 domain-containing protein [Streptomyces chumphonensis]